MQLLGKRSLAWGLKWINDAAILSLSVILVGVLVLLAVRSPPGGEWPFMLDLPLPDQIVEPASAEIEVTRVVSPVTTIGFTTSENDWQGGVLGFSGIVIGLGMIIWILWLLRKILVSLVANQPLTEANARHFRSIGLLMVLGVVLDSFWRISVYFYLQQHFQGLPSAGYFRLFRESLELNNLFQALLVLLMAEALRLGAEHRVDSEAVI